ncbi:hypothetical protein [Salipaludibacillus neizhouensis]|nr:hypothetical protein [Salipaludibacillus neizhouensis]
MKTKTQTPAGRQLLVENFFLAKAEAFTLRKASVLEQIRATTSKKNV